MKLSLRLVIHIPNFHSSEDSLTALLLYLLMLSYIIFHSYNMLHVHNS